MVARERLTLIRLFEELRCLGYGAEKQRPERIPVDPDHRSCSHNATGAAAIDPLLRNGRQRLTITRRGEIVSSVPVFGVRPIR
jgi:hypothetical protein